MHHLEHAVRRPVDHSPTDDPRPTVLDPVLALRGLTGESEDSAAVAEAAVAAAEAVAAAAAAEVACEAASTAQAAVDTARAAAAKAADRAQRVAADAAGVVAAAAAVQQGRSGADRTAQASTRTEKPSARGIERVAAPTQGAAEAAACQSAQAQRVARRVVVVAKAAATAALDAARVVAAQLHTDAAAAADDVASLPLADDGHSAVSATAETAATVVHRGQASALGETHPLTDNPLEPYLAVSQQDGSPGTASLAESNDLTAALIASAADAIVGVDHNCVVTVWNAGCESLSGWTATEMLGSSVGGSRSTFHVAVNLSAKQLTGGGVVDVVRRALAETGAAPGNSLGQGLLWSPGLDVTTFEAWLVAALQDQAAIAAPAATQDAVTAARPRPPDHLPTEPVVLNRVAELTATGASLTTIAAALNADQQLTPGGKRWTSHTVAQLLAKRPLS